MEKHFDANNNYNDEYNDATDAIDVDELNAKNDKEDFINPQFYDDIDYKSTFQTEIEALKQIYKEPGEEVSKGFNRRVMDGETVAHLSNKADMTNSVFTREWRQAIKHLLHRYSGPAAVTLATILLFNPMRVSFFDPTGYKGDKQLAFYIQIAFILLPVISYFIAWIFLKERHLFKAYAGIATHYSVGRICEFIYRKWNTPDRLFFWLGFIPFAGPILIGCISVVCFAVRFIVVLLPRLVNFIILAILLYFPIILVFIDLSFTMPDIQSAWYCVRQERIYKGLLLEDEFNDKIAEL